MVLFGIKKEIDNSRKEKKVLKQKNGTNSEVRIEEQTQSGNGNVTNYYNCHIENKILDQNGSKNDEIFVQEQIEKYMETHTVTDEDINSLFVEDVHNNTPKVEKQKSNVGHTVTVDNEEYIPKRVLDENNEEILKMLSEI